MYNSDAILRQIKERAKEKGVSIKEMLDYCELDEIIISPSEQSEKHLQRVDVLASISSCLGCSIDYLVGRTNNPNISRPLATTGKDFINDKMTSELIEGFEKLSINDKIDILEIISNKN